MKFEIPITKSLLIILKKISTLNALLLKVKYILLKNQIQNLCFVWLQPFNMQHQLSPWKYDAYMVILSFLISTRLVLNWWIFNADFDFQMLKFAPRNLPPWVANWAKPLPKDLSASVLNWNCPCLWTRGELWKQNENTIYFSDQKRHAKWTYKRTPLKNL